MRFVLPPGTPIRPYAVTASMNKAWIEAGLPSETRWRDPFCADDVPYCLALNRANSYAHDGTPEPGSSEGALGMPRWVQLDCCLLPSAMVGFEVPRTALDAAVADMLDPSGTLEWIAVSEYVALPSVETGRYIGISLFSLVTGAGLGVRSKALGLRAVGGTELIGVTQYASPGVAVHLRFGPLAIVTESVGVHSRPGETFVYRLDIPPADVLADLVAGTRVDAGAYIPDEWQVGVRFDPRDEKAREAAMSYVREAPTWVLEHGPIIDGKISELVLGRPR